MRISPGSALSWEQPVRRQSEHFDDYRAALDQLEAQGLIYPSFESRAEIARMVADRDVRERWPRDPDGAPLYPGAARTDAAAERQARIAARRALCDAPRHGEGDGMDRRAALARDRQRARRRER